MTASSIVFSSQGQRAKSPTIARLMTMALEKQGLLSLAAGFTDNSSLPMEEVEAAVKALTQGGENREILQYGMNQGRPDLRKQLAERFLGLEPDAGLGLDLVRNCLVTNGSQQALYLAVQVLCDAGDIVLVDRPSYFVFLEMLQGLGVRAVSLPTKADGGVDGEGLEKLLGELEAAGERRRVKALYFVSYFSNPSSRSMSEEEKELIAHALRKRAMLVPVIEDAAYRDLYFEKPFAARSVLSLAAWEGFPRLYLATMTKSFATGLKIGYGFCSHEAWLSRMLNIKGHQDFGSSNFGQAICQQVMANGGFERQLTKIRSIYLHKMQVLNRSLEEGGLRELGWSWTVPTGGLYLWLQAPAGLDTRLDSELCQRCLEAGVIYVPGDLCHGDHAPHNRVRLSFGVLGEEALREAGSRFVGAVRSMSKAAAN
jgi:2-aminoadipate transaminase